MATAAKHDVPLTLTVETVGLESIKQLKSDVAALGKQGADAVPEFAKLGAEIDKLADQAALVTTFGQLSDEVGDLSAAQTKASSTSKDLASKLAEQKVVTDGLRVTELQAKQSLELAQTALFEKKQALADLKNGTSDYTAQARLHTAEIIKARGEIRNLTLEYKNSKVETAAASAVEKSAAAELKTSTAITNAANNALSKRNAALIDTKSSLTAAGIASDDFAKAEADLAAAHNKLTSEVLATSTALSDSKARKAEMAEADRLLAIEQRGLADLFEKGRVALIAETTTIQEAARWSADYTAKKQAEAAALAEAEAKWQKEAFAIVENVEAKRRNLKELHQLIEAQNFLIEQDADAKWQKEAFALVEAAEAAQKLRRETDLLAEADRLLANDVTIAAAALQKIDTAAKEAGDGIATALGTVGVKSAAEIRAEIDRVKAALDLLKSSGTLVGTELSTAFGKGEVKIKQLERDLREVNGQMTLGDKAAKLFSGSLAQISAGNVIADGVGFLVEKVKDLGREFFNVNLESQRLTKALTQVYGDSVKAGSQFEFLRSVTDAAGVSIRDVSDGFLRFSAATETSGIALEQSNSIFKAVTNSAGFLGLRGEQVTGVLEALGQMASKGTVSLEELRGQLGDRLPGALGIAAKGMQMTQGELIKMIESGELATNVFFPAFQKGLEQTFGDGEKKIEGFIQGWNRLINAIVKTAQQASDTTMFTAMGKAFDFVAANIDTVVKGLEILAVRFGVIKAIDIAASFLNLGSAANKASIDIANKAAAVSADTVATELNTIATNSNTVAKGQNAAQWAALGTGVLATSGTLKGAATEIGNVTLASRAATVAKTGLAGAFGLAAGAARGLTAMLGGPVGLLVTLAVFGKDIGESAAKMMGWGKVLEENEKKIAAYAAAEAKAHKERAAQQAEQDLANMKASAAATLAVKQAEDMVVAIGKEVKASEQKLKATQDLVNLQGVNQAGLVALTAASQALVDANTKELLAKEQLVVEAKAEIDAINLTKDAKGNLTKAQQEQVASLETLIVSRIGDANAQRETVRQAEVEVASRRVVSESYKDNSLRVKELGDAYENAKSKLSVMAESGVASLVQLQKAELDVAVALKLKNDALSDSVDKSKLAQAQSQADIATTKDLITGKIEHNNLLVKEATLRGDLSAVTKLEVAGKQLVIDQLKLEIDARTSANNAALEQTATLRKEIDASTAAGQARLKELDIADQLTKSKQALNLTGLDVVKGLEKELAASKDAANGMMSLVDAYKQLGVQSPQELAKVATASKSAWDSIKTDTTASVGTLTAAFDAYAKAAIAASGEVGSSQRQATEAVLKTEAATKGLTVAFDQTGKMIVSSMSAGSKAIDSTAKYMDVFAEVAAKATAALEKQNKEIERGISAQEKANELKQRAIDLENKRRNMDKEGFALNTNGERINEAVPTGRSVYEQAKGQGLTEAQALQIMNQFMQNDKMVNANGYTNANGETWYTALQKAIDKIVLENAAKAAKTDQRGVPLPEKSGQQSQPGTTSVSPKPDATSAKTYTVIVNMNGSNTPINTSSDADAQALIRVLQQAKLRT